MRISQASNTVQPTSNNTQEVNTMKNFKRIQTMFLAVILAVMSIGTTAFAAESTVTNDSTIVSENVASSHPIGSYPRDLVPEDRNYSFYPSRAGHSFQCKSGKVDINISFTPNDGNTILAVRLKDTSAAYTVKEWQSSNGNIRDYITVTAGHSYIFEYLCAYGTRTITVNNYSSERMYSDF